MAALPWKPLFWQCVEDSCAIASAARGHLAAATAAFDLALASPLRGGDVDHAVSLIEESGDKLATAGKHLAILLSSLGTIELLARRRMRGDDSLEQQARPRARAVRARAGAAYDEVALSRGHVGAVARLVAHGDLPAIFFRAELLAATRAAASASEHLHGVEDALRIRGDQAPPLLPLHRTVDSNTRPAAAAAHPSAKRDEGRDKAWKALAGSAPAALLRGCAELPELEAAHAELGRCVNAVKSSTAKKAAADTYRAALRALDAAHTAVSSVRATNAEVASLLLLAGLHLGLNNGGPRWQSWEASRADAGRHGRAALDLIWSASSCVDYVLGLLWWDASTSQEGDEVLRRAVAEAGEAVEAANSMRQAICFFYFNTVCLLNAT